MHSTTKHIGVLMTLFANLAAGAAEQPLTLEQIMADPDWLGNAPENPFWSEDGGAVFFERKRPGEKIRDLYVVNRDGSGLKQVEPAALGTFARPEGDYDPEYKRKAFVHAGDVYVMDLGSGEIRQLSRTPEIEAHPLFMADGRHVAWQREQQYELYDLETGLVSRAADVRLTSDPDAEEPAFDFLESQQQRVFATLREDKRRQESSRDHARGLQRGDPARPPLPFFLGDGLEIVDQALSPGGRWLLLATVKAEHETARVGQMPNYVTPSGYVESREVRTRVGLNHPAPQSLWLLDLENHSQHALDLAGLPGIKRDPLAKLRKSALKWHVEHGADEEQTKKALTAPDIRPVQAEGISWTRDGSQVVIQLHSIDNKDRWLVTVDFDEQRLVTQHRVTDPAWINWHHNEFGWLPDNRTLWFLSEEDGYSHLYLKDLRQRRPRQLTRGEFIVEYPVVNRSGSHLYYRANRAHPGDYDVFRAAVDSGEIEQLTDRGGLHEFVLSPDEQYLLLSHSRLGDPTELFVQSNQPGAEPSRITHTISAAFGAVDWTLPEIVAVPSSRVDRPIYARLYKPADFDPRGSYPAVIFVHGAGYLQNSHRGWSKYFREFMFHTLLTRHGYVVLDMDYRGSRGYGRDWRTAIYRNMGHPELEDIEDGVRWLAENHGVDPQRLGIYGGSYGGFMTFMALFRSPKTFQAGAALRPVTNWAHYNHPYTSNILNTPQVDPVAFERSSPINFVEGLERPLLICVGMQDDNVFFQDSVFLVQRLIELKKEDFEMAVYPLDPHGFIHPDSWLDEYRRIFKLMERYVK